MKNYSLIIFTFASFNVFGLDPILISGNNSPGNEIQVKIDLSRICSNPSDNDPNHYFAINGKEITLRISIDFTIICDPPPPPTTDEFYAEFNLSTLGSGEYQFYLEFVDSNESVITGTSMILGQYPRPFIFRVAQSIPGLQFYSLIGLFFILLLFGLSKIHKIKIPH